MPDEHKIYISLPVGIYWFSWCLCGVSFPAADVVTARNLIAQHIVLCAIKEVMNNGTTTS